MPNQRGFSKIAIIIIVLILIGGAYFVFSKKGENVIVQNAKNQNSQSSNSSIDQLSTDNWKTYRNDEFGFEIKYPFSWLYKDVSDANLSAYLVLGAKKDFDNNILPVFSMGAREENGAMWIAYGAEIDNDENIAITKSIESLLEEKEYRHTAEIKKEEDIIVNGKNGKIIYIKGNQSSNNIDRWVFIPGDDGFLYLLGIVFDKPLYSDIFNQIISTFKTVK